MRCPYCNKRMVKGVVAVHGTILGLVIYGLSRQDLWFHSDGNQKEKILESGAKRYAWRCASCDCTTISGTEERELDFLKVVEATRATPNQAL